MKRDAGSPESEVCPACGGEGEQGQWVMVNECADWETRTCPSCHGTGFGPTALGAFHAHLDVCGQCRDHPFDLCHVGVPLLQAVAPSADKERGT